MTKDTDGNKLWLYRIHKERVEQESYVTMSLNKESRKAIAQVRSGTMALYIETAIFNKTPLSEMICMFHNSGKIEDEKHFLLDCELHNNIRYDLLQ